LIRINLAVGRRLTRGGRYRRGWQAALLVAMLADSGCGRGQAPAFSPPSPPPPAKTEVRPATAPGVDADIAATIQEVLSSARHPSLKWGRIPDVAPVLQTLYAGEPDGLFWFDHGAPVPSLKPTLAAVAAAAEHGLDAGDYDAALLTQQFALLGPKPAAGAELALFDLGVSTAVARMLKAVHKGRVDPATMYWGYDNSVKALDIPLLMMTVRDKDGLTATLDTVSPQVSHYGRAKRVLAVYRARAQAGEPDPVPGLPKDRPKVQPGESWEAIPVLAKRLQVFGDLKTGVTVEGAEYSMPVVDAVKSFQRRHGLTSDGVIGAGTLRAVNVPLAKRVRQIELAMERMRWLPTLSDKPNVFVNVALFRLWATDPMTGDDPLRMNVVVGESLNHQTPLFVEKMEYVIFRPYWNPPQSVIVKELVPKARRDPSFLEKEGMEIVASGDEKATPLPPTPENLTKVVAGRLRLRQKPGPKNALGLAKFIFPNDEDVYMHGTPSQQLFSRARRDFSHGCIRLENPAKFAEWVLRDQPMWTREQIEAAMQGDKPTRVNLKQPLTVVLFYDTVHVNSQGVLFFMDDIYGHDRALDAALMRGYPYPSKGEVTPKKPVEEAAP
jgi:murein L,D-transpeptidase YcbB/YkuD